MRGGNLNALAKIMGHSKVSMTERYGHITPNHVADELEKMRFGDRSSIISPNLAPENVG
jgi:integrase